MITDAKLEEWEKECQFSDLTITKDLIQEVKRLRSLVEDHGMAMDYGLQLIIRRHDIDEGVKMKALEALSRLRAERGE